MHAYYEIKCILLFTDYLYELHYYAMCSSNYFEPSNMLRGIFSTVLLFAYHVCFHKFESIPFLFVYEGNMPTFNSKEYTIRKDTVFVVTYKVIFTCYST